MQRANQDLRFKAKENGVYQWQIAQKMGISETHLLRKMRTELPEDEKKAIFQIIQDLARDPLI